MTIEVELSAETQATLAAQAAARSMDVPSYAASLLEEAARESAACKRAGRKNLAQLFAESPFKGVALNLERDNLH
ncbi:hypothetical protein [Terracidiphilus sp.]|jgi:hypothetical protein|uniref:hypothetical protein n=1 Tax=Terracidiphilus sp. TaxID=1964191 RepID=UPI003C24731A